MDYKVLPSGLAPIQPSKESITKIDKNFQLPRQKRKRSIGIDFIATYSQIFRPFSSFITLYSK